MNGNEISVNEDQVLMNEKNLKKLLRGLYFCFSLCVFCVCVCPHLKVRARHSKKKRVRKMLFLNVRHK